MPDGKDKERARTRFYVRLAAMYHSRDGFTHHLARDIGLRPNGLNAGVSYWTFVPAEIAWKIQEALGPELFPIGLLNPTFARTE